MNDQTKTLKQIIDACTPEMILAHASEPNAWYIISEVRNQIDMYESGFIFTEACVNGIKNFLKDIYHIYFNNYPKSIEKIEE